MAPMLMPWPPWPEIFVIADEHGAAPRAVGQAGDAEGRVAAQLQRVAIVVVLAHEMGHVPKRGEHTVLAGLNFTVMLTKGGAVKWFRVSPAQTAPAHGAKKA